MGPAIKEKFEVYCPNTACPDVKQTGIPGEYRDGIAQCPRCGCSLVPASPSSAEEAEEQDEPREVSYEFEAFVPVWEVANRALVPLVHSLMDAAGIRYFIRDENILHRLTALRGAEVFVDPSRVDEARAILSELEVRG